ncbi:hypothetical protein ACFPYJ_24410 [Paenibacillus solisilvae]|uniref:Cupin domain-containing protein n=1 Tax=Paenibacillus solisilvae TaxID=2486751 RepID=A0ABW0W422_9BACL
MNPYNLISFYFQDDGTIPNNPGLPVLLYPAAFKGKSDHVERTFNRNNWLNSWTNGVYSYHHYHSNVHEVLGVTGGSAVLKIGGEEGAEVNVQEGDIIILPAGTGHKRLRSSSDFIVVGAYPEGMDYNLRTGKEGERPAVLEEIKSVPLPDRDPVYGRNGPLAELWKRGRP